MDLSKLDTRKACEAGAVMELFYEGSPVLQDDEKTPVTITLRGKDSDTVQRAVRRRADNRAEARKPAKVTLDTLEAEGVEGLADCTIGWDGMVVDGETITCTRETVIEVYTRFPWLREQVEAFVNARTNFLKLAPKN